MEKIKKISVEQCCIYYSIESSFVQELNDYGLIKLNRTGKKLFIDYDQLADLEKYIRMHFDLEINMPGLEAIKHLLARMDYLQQELKQIKERN